MAFEIRVPTGKKGSKGGSANYGGNSDETQRHKDSEKTNRLLKKLDKSLIATYDVFEILSGALNDLAKLFSPLIKILGLLLFVIFLPLLPAIIWLTKLIAKLIGVFTGDYGNIAKKIGNIILFIISAVVLAMLAGLAFIPALIIAVVLAIILAIWKFRKQIWQFLKWFGGVISDFAKFLWEKFTKLLTAIGDFIKWFGEKVVELVMWYIETFITVWTSVFEFISKFGLWIWEIFKKGLEKVSQFSKWIWDIFVAGLKGLGNIGARIANYIMSKVRSAASKIGSTAKKVGSALNPFDDFISRPGQAPIGFSPNDTIIGMKDIGKLGGGTTININNPVVRDDSDIRKLTDSISRELQRRGNRGFSGI